MAVKKKTAPKDQGLTGKQEAFAVEYIRNGYNASAAYRKAYDAKNMSQEAIWVKASELLKNGKVRVRVEELKKTALRRHEVTAERVIEELARVGFANMMDYMTPQEDGTCVLDFSALDRDAAAAIGSIEIDAIPKKDGDETFTVLKTKFKLHDKLNALEKLGKHLDIYAPDKHEVSGPGGNPIEVISDMESARRVAFLLGRAVERGNKKSVDVDT